MHRTRVPQVRVVQTPGANVEIACGRRQLRQVSRLPASPISARSSKQCLCAPDAERAIRAGLGSIEAVARLDVEVHLQPATPPHLPSTLRIFRAEATAQWQDAVAAA